MHFACFLRSSQQRLRQNGLELKGKGIPGTADFPDGVWEIGINSPAAFWQILSAGNCADGLCENLPIRTSVPIPRLLLPHRKPSFALNLGTQFHLAGQVEPVLGCKNLIAFAQHRILDDGNRSMSIRGAVRPESVLATAFFVFMLCPESCADTLTQLVTQRVTNPECRLRREGEIKLAAILENCGRDDVVRATEDERKRSRSRFPRTLLGNQGKSVRN